MERRDQLKQVIELIRHSMVPHFTSLKIERILDREYVTTILNIDVTISGWIHAVGQYLDSDMIRVRKINWIGTAHTQVNIWRRLTHHLPIFAFLR